MDADHRHELKENDLAEFITNFGSWWSKHGTTLLIAVLVIAAVLVGKRFVESRNAAVQEEAWSDLALASSPESYRAVAQSHSLQTVQALADLRGADLWLEKAVAPAPLPKEEAAADTPETTASASITQQALDEAALAYERVANDSQAHHVFKLNAHLGLAAVAEGREDWAQAHKQYTRVIEQAGTGYEAIAAQAKARMAQLDRLKNPVVFGPDPEPVATTPAPQPAPEVDTSLDLTPLQPGDIDLPQPVETP